MSWQDLCKRPLGQTLEEISLSEISIEDLCSSSLYKISIRNLPARSLYKITVGYCSMFWVGLGPAFYRTDGSQTTKIKLCNVLIVSAVALSWRNCEWMNDSLILMVGSMLVPAIGKVIVAILELTRVNVSKLDFKEGLRSSFRRYRADPGSIWSSGDFLITWPTARLCVIQVSDLSASDGNVLACHGCEANLFCWSGLRSAN